MKKALFSLVALGMLSANVFAEDAYQEKYSRDASSWEEQTDLTDWSASAGVAVDATKGLGKNGNQTATYASKTFTYAENSKVKMEVEWTFGCATGRTGNLNYIAFGNQVFVAVNSSYSVKLVTGTLNEANYNVGVEVFKAGNATFTKKIEIVYDSATDAVESFTFDGADKTELVAGKTSGAINSIKTGFIRGGSVNWGLDNFLTSVKVSEFEQSVSKADYKVKFVCGETVVKDEATRAGVIGAATAITALDKENVLVDGKKYVYASDNSGDIKIASDGTSVVTVTFTEVATGNYTISNSFGTVLKEGQGFVDETASVAYPKYILDNGTLYKADAQATGSKYVYSLLIGDANATINYAEDVEDVVYYSELENIEGVKRSFDNASASNNKIGDFQGATEDILLTTLAPGKYKIVFHYLSVNSSNPMVTFVAHDNTVFEQQTEQGDKEYTSAEFSVSSARRLWIKAFEGGSAKGIDYIYVIKTAEPTSLDAIAPAAPAAKGIYNLAGQKLSEPQKGLNIIDGKKVVVKN